MRRLVGRPSVLGLGLAVLSLVPAVANPYLVYVTSIALLYVILAVGLNLLLGYAGQFAFANAALFGIGAYATGLAQLKLGGRSGSRAGGSAVYALRDCLSPCPRSDSRGSTWHWHDALRPVPQ